MLRISAQAALTVGLAAGFTILSAATPSIGVAISDGAIRINDARTAGNASVFSGTTLETERAAQVRLNNGARLQFGGASKGQLYSDHVNLQQGSASFSGVSANANGLRISPDVNSSANVELHGKVVQVAAVTGSVHVFNAHGINVANLVPGRALSLTMQDAGASAPSSMTGCVTMANGVSTLMDETSNVMVQLRGGTNMRAGQRVQVTGTMVPGATAAGGATQVLAVTSVKEVGGACRAGTGAAAAGAAGAAGAAAGAAAGGAAAGIGASTAVIAGVAAAGVAATAGAVAASSTGSGGTTTGGGNGVPVGCIGVSPCQ